MLPTVADSPAVKDYLGRMYTALATVSTTKEEFPLAVVQEAVYKVFETSCVRLSQLIEKEWQRMLEQPGVQGFLATSRALAPR